MLAAMPFVAKFLPETKIDTDDYLTDSDKWFIKYPNDFRGQTLFVRSDPKIVQRDGTQRQPYRNIGRALNDCDRGDIVYLLPGHTETRPVVVSKAGVNIIGM